MGMEYNEDLDYIVPDEGGNLWIDSWFVPRTCKHYDAAMKWIDFMCREDIAKMNAEYITYETTNKKAEELLSSEYKLSGDIVEDYSNNKNEIFKYLGEDAEEEYNKRWKNVKGS